MDVIIYPDPSSPAPSRLQVVFPANDTLEEYAFKYLESYSIDYLTVEYSTIPQSPYIGAAQLVEFVSGDPVYSYDLDEAKDIASGINSRYWQNQYDAGLLGVGITNDYQLQLAVATPEGERTADQIAAIEFMSGINGLQTEVQDEIDAATTGEEIITILSQLG
jgi:hypothetical protein